MSIHPSLALLAAFALPTVLDFDVAAGRGARRGRAGASANRLARHLFVTATTAPPGKEVRVTGIGERLVAWRRAAWERWYGPVATARWGSALVAHAGVGVLRRRFRRRRGVRDASVSMRRRAMCCWCSRPARGSRRTSAATVGEIGFLRGYLARRFDAPGLARGLRGRLIEHCKRPGAGAALSTAFASSMSLSPIPAPSAACSRTSAWILPPGSVVAIVGENGAGKTTLVKLLVPALSADERTHPGGRARPRANARDEWRSRLAGAFQDFFRFEFRARHTVGVGDVARLDDEPAVGSGGRTAAGGRRGRRLSSGLETQLGPTWPDGVEVSFGQWQKLALARGFMRDHPLLLVLDEPTAALDAETEHALFERYAAAARGGKSNGAAAGTTAGSRSWCRIASAPCAWPISSSCSTAPAWSRWALTRS